MDTTAQDSTPWYAGVTRYQWLVLAIASAGWIFDTFEGQLFNILRMQMLSDLLGAPAGSPEVRRWGDIFLAVFLIGGTVGGVVFGALADRFGRKPTMAATILFYSVFSGLTYFATSLWHIAALRFLVALGVGGEWAVAAALVAEVFPLKSRTHASGIFHSTSVLGTWLAALSGMVVGAQWRYAYLLGVVPALLVFCVRAGVREPVRQTIPVEGGNATQGLRALFGNPRWRRPALLGIGLAMVGMGTFWGVAVAGQDLANQMLRQSGVSAAVADERAKFAYGIVQTLGGGLGLLAFGPIAQRLGRRGAFALIQFLAFLIVPVTCYLPQTYGQLLCILPVFGFFTLSCHAGFAIYFPELFPDHLRATGAGVCFNGGRILAAPVIWISASLKGRPDIDLRLAMTMLGSLFLVGVVIVWFLPETKGKDLPTAEPEAVEDLPFAGP